MKLHNLEAKPEATQWKLRHQWVIWHQSWLNSNFTQSPPVDKGEKCISMSGRIILLPLQSRWEKQNKFKDVVFVVSLHVFSEWLTTRKKRTRVIKTAVPSHRKDVDMYLLLILDLSGKVLPIHHVEILVEKLQLLETSDLTKQSKGRDCRYIQSQNPSCSALINLISVASKSS